MACADDASANAKATAVNLIIALSPLVSLQKKRMLAWRANRVVIVVAGTPGHQLGILTDRKGNIDPGFLAGNFDR